MDDRFSGILEFVTTVDNGSFTAAAEKLGVTGSAIGKSITRLENRLGVQLLHRTTRRISLTSEGEAWLTSCRRILEELEHVEVFLSTGHQYPTGRIRIDLPTTFGRRHIFPTLLALGLKYPQLDLSITFQDRVVDMVSEGIDIAVRIGELKDYPDLIARQLGKQKLFIYASPEYLKHKGQPINCQDLKEHDCLIGWRRDNKSNWLLKDTSGKTQTYEVNYRHELTDGDALLTACIAGCGLAQIPSWLAFEGLKEGTLIPVLSEISGVEMPIHVIWQKKWHLQPKVRVIVDELIKLASDKPEFFLK